MFLASLCRFQVHVLGCGTVLEPIAPAGDRDELGALEEAVENGLRESEQSWTEVMLDLKSRGLPEGPKLAVGDGALGFLGSTAEGVR